MNATNDNLREDLKDPEIAEGYAESFLDSYIATQIKVLRDQNKLSQAQLAEMIGTKQGAISRIEDVNYSKWNVTTLKKLARAFRLRLKVSFETYGTLIDEVENFSRQGLERSPRESDPILYPTEQPTMVIHHGSLFDNATFLHVGPGTGNNATGQLCLNLFGVEHSHFDADTLYHNYPKPPSAPSAARSAWGSW